MNNTPNQDHDQNQNSQNSQNTKSTGPKASPVAAAPRPMPVAHPAEKAPTSIAPKSATTPSSEGSAKESKSDSEGRSPEWVTHAMERIDEVDHSVRNWISARPMLISIAAVGVGLAASFLARKLNQTADSVGKSYDEKAAS